MTFERKFHGTLTAQLAHEAVEGGKIFICYVAHSGTLTDLVHSSHGVHRVVFGRSGSGTVALSDSLSIHQIDIG